MTYKKAPRRPLRRASGAALAHLARCKYSSSARDRDRRWFQDHPDEDSFIRCIMPGEFGHAQTRESHVLVTQIAPGVRHRIALRIFREGNGPLTHLFFLPTAEIWEIAPDGALTPIEGTTREPSEALCGDDLRPLIRRARAMGGAR